MRNLYLSVIIVLSLTACNKEAATVRETEGAKQPDVGAAVVQGSIDASSACISAGKFRKGGYQVFGPFSKGEIYATEEHKFVVIAIHSLPIDCREAAAE